jgi:hypothetical protein
MEQKNPLSKDLPLSENDKKKLLKENIIFINYSLTNNSILLLSSNNIIYLCQIIDDYLRIIKKLVNIINNSQTKLYNCYFCNENKNIILLFCDDYNIYEYTLDREYISHIYYNSLGDSFLFKMNCQKNRNPENEIRNFCILKNCELNVWNTLKFNKSNVLCVQDVNCFSYDCTGVVIYVLGKSIKNSYYLSLIKFINEYEYKEIYFKLLDFVELKLDINYLDIFDNNIIMSDKKFSNIYILKNYPINRFEFIINLNNKDGIPLSFFPFIGQNPLYQLGILFMGNNKRPKILNICFKTKKFNIVETQINIQNSYFFNENVKGKGVLLAFDDINKQLTKYFI